MTLPYPIRSDVMMHLHEELVKKVPMFQQAEGSFLRALVVRLGNQVILQGDYLFRQGDAGQEMFFVREGAMDVVILVERAGSEVAAKLEKVVATLKSGSFFGEISLILQERRTASMRAATRCDLCSLDKAAFDELLELYPESKAPITAAALRRMKRDMDLNQAELGEKEKLAPARKAFPDADPPRDSFARRGKKEDASRSPSRARRLMAGVEGSFKRLSGVGMPPSADRSTTPKIIKRRNSIPGTVSTSSESGEGNGSAGDGTAASQEASFKQEAQDEFRMSSVADEKEQAAAAAAAAAAADDEPHFERERRTSFAPGTSAPGFPVRGRNSDASDSPELEAKMERLRRFEGTSQRNSAQERRSSESGGGGGGGSGSGGGGGGGETPPSILRLSDVPGGGRKSSTNKLRIEEYSPRDGGGGGSGSGGGSSTRSPDAAKPPTTATTPPRAREEAAAEALRSLMAEQQLSQTDLLRGLALL